MIASSDVLVVSSELISDQWASEKRLMKDAGAAGLRTDYKGSVKYKRDSSAEKMSRSTHDRVIVFVRVRLLEEREGLEILRLFLGLGLGSITRLGRLFGCSVLVMSG